MFILLSCLARSTSTDHFQPTLCKTPTTRSINHLKKKKKQPKPPTPLEVWSYLSTLGRLEAIVWVLTFPFHTETLA